MMQGAHTGALWQPGWGCGGMGQDVGGRLKSEGTCVHLWLIHVDVWQKPAQYCKAMILQLKINTFFKKMKKKKQCPFLVWSAFFLSNRLKFIIHEPALPSAALAKRATVCIDTELLPCLICTRFCKNNSSLHFIASEPLNCGKHGPLVTLLWHFTWVYFWMPFLFVIKCFTNDTYFWPWTLTQWLNSKVRMHSFMAMVV